MGVDVLEQAVSDDDRDVGFHTERRLPGFEVGDVVQEGHSQHATGAATSGGIVRSPPLDVCDDGSGLLRADTTAAKELREQLVEKGAPRERPAAWSRWKVVSEHALSPPRPRQISVDRRYRFAQ
ncbi:MAG: hypothetical protein ACRDPQ_10065 [Nocardioidaceae bacterium]